VVVQVIVLHVVSSVRLFSSECLIKHAGTVPENEVLHLIFAVALFINWRLIHFLTIRSCSLADLRQNLFLA